MKVEYPRDTYVCRGLIRYEPEDSPDVPQYAAYCLNLPGVFSQGDTHEEAKANLEEAFEACVQTYLDEGAEIPWAELDIDRWEREVSMSVKVVAQTTEAR